MDDNGESDMASIEDRDMNSQEETKENIRLYLYEWLISNFPMVLPLQKILGPVISIGTVDNVKMNLWLELRSYKNYVIGVQFTSNDSLRKFVDEIYVQVFLVDLKGNILTTHMTIKSEEEKLCYNNFEYEMGGDISSYARNNCLIMKAEITIKSHNAPLFARVSPASSSVKKLSDDMERLLREGQAFSNIIVKTRGHEFHLHKSILYGRCPFLEQLSMVYKEAIFSYDFDGKLIVITYPHPQITFIRRGSVTTIQIDDDFSGVIIPVLYYIYCNKIVPLESSQYFQMHNTAEKMHLTDLCTQLLPNAIRSESRIKVEIASCLFRIKNFPSRQDGEIIGTCMLKTEAQGEISWKIILTTYLDSHCIHLSLQRMSGKHLNVLTNIKIYAFGENAKINCLGESTYIFKKYDPMKEMENSDELSSPYLVPRYCLHDGTLVLPCSLLVSSGDIDVKHHSLFCANPELIELKELSNSMRSLYSLNKYCDFTIKMPEFYARVHKAVISMRSPVFAEVVNRREDTDIFAVEEQTVSPAIMKLLLTFIYTGEIDNVSMNNVKMLYKAAKEYAIHDLKEECVRFITANIDLENAERIFNFAQEENIEDLKVNVASFLTRMSDTEEHYDLFASVLLSSCI